MEQSIYKCVFDRRKQLNETLNNFIQCYTDALIFDFSTIDNIDEKEICFEIDQFVKEYPKTYEKYLPDLLKEYLIMQTLKNKFISEYQPYIDDRRMTEFFFYIDFIIDHLQFTLGEERHRFIDLIDRIKDTEAMPQLSTDLSIEQRERLYAELVEGKFISDTNKESFIWVFGKPNEKQPLQWKPIKWLGKDQGLRELLKPLIEKRIITNQHIRNIEKLFIDDNSSPLVLSKSKGFSARCREIESITTLVRNIPTNSQTV